MRGSRRTKRLRRLGIAVGIAIVVLVFLRFSACGPGQPRPLSIIVYDKTVPDRSYREHKAFFNVLGSDYIDSATGRYFEPEHDYYGFVPLPDETYVIRPLPPRYDGVDLFYLVDAYGVYTLDFYGTNPRGQRSQKIYGGLTLRDVAEARRAVHAGALFIGEFNTFASPTGDAAQTAMASFLGVRWTGWIGRYFTNLAREGEVPVWAVDNYERETGHRWQFRGPGYILVRQDHIVVLVEEEDIEAQGCVFEWNETGRKIFPDSRRSVYQYWFDILETDTGTISLADFKLKVTPKGADILLREKLPATFPAVILNETTAYTSFYFAGDFADRDDRFIFLRSDKESLFYRRSYRPMMEKILDRVASSRKAPKPLRFK
ncbi:MAG: hypothetical protein AAB229_07995 [Candidatus Hydrogenedentota bacterium]